MYPSTDETDVKPEDLGVGTMFGSAPGGASTSSGSNTPALAFGGGSPAPAALAFGNNNARTIYSNNNFAFGGGVKKEEANDVDDFGMTSTSFGGRSTGIGRIPSNGAMDSPAPDSGSGEPTRKRLRRGGNPLGDDSAASSRPASTPNSNIASPGDSDPTLAHFGAETPSGFTAGLQNRLADFNVDSGPPSSASSAYGGNGMQRNDSWQGDDSQSQPVVAPGLAAKGKMRDDEDSQSQSPGVRPTGRLIRGTRPEQTPGGGPSPFASGASPPVGYPAAVPRQSPYANYSPLPQSTIPPASPAPAPGQDPAFDRFNLMIGTNFSRQAAYVAWLQAGKVDMQAIGLLVNAKPAPSTSALPAEAMYAQVNSPLSTPGGQQYAQQQVGQGRNPIQVLSRPAPPQQQQSQQMAMGYRPPPMQPQPGMTPQQQQYAYAQQQQQQQQGAPRQSYPASAPPTGLSKEHIENFRRLQQKTQMNQATPEERQQLATYHAHIEAASRNHALRQQQYQQQMQQRQPQQPQQYYPNGQPVPAMVSRVDSLEKRTPKLMIRRACSQSGQPMVCSAVGRFL